MSEVTQGTARSNPTWCDPKIGPSGRGVDKTVSVRRWLSFAAHLPGSTPLSCLSSKAALLCGLLALVTACGHPAERALQGQWLGSAVENFDPGVTAAATGWARGTSLEFSGRRLKVTLPAQTPKIGVYELAAIEDRTVKLNVLSSEGESSELELIVDDEQTMRWVMGEGRTMLLHKK
jgi:hypothetical protein